MTGMCEAEAKPRFLIFMSNNNHDAKILLNYYYYIFFNWTFLGLRSGPLDFFWVRI